VQKEANVARIKHFCKQIFARGISWFLVILSIALVLTACSSDEPTQYVVDDLERSVAINGTPQRIVSIAPSNTEILFALGLGEKVVGVTDWCDYPPEALDKEKVGAYDTPDIEKIHALNPDLILAAHGTSIDVINALEGLGLTVFGIKSTDLDDLLNDIRTVGNITGKEAEANALTSEMESRIEAVTSETSELEERPRVFYITWHDPLWTAGSGTFIHELVEKGGGVNICGNLTGDLTISIEEVVARDPEIIITSSWPGVYEWAMNSTELEVTAARQSGSVYKCDDNLVQRPGPRLVEGLEWFAYFIHPEIFEEPED
jgi:iron complex transport system substrate-binding protein